jgi:hypothetical protein
MHTNRLNLRKVAMIAACLAVTIGFASCDKDNAPKEEDVFLLEEILWLASDIGRHVFEYDSHERIIKYSYYYNSDLPYLVNSLIYNADGDLVEVTLSVYEGLSLFAERTTKFIKIDNLINTSYGIIELNGQGLPIKYTRSSQEETLIWQNGNLVKRVFVDAVNSSQSQIKSTFTYDNMKSPFYHCKTPKWFFIWFLGQGGLAGYWNVNNIIDEEIIINDEIQDILPYSYTYNDNGFPVSSNRLKHATTTEFRYMKR